MGTPHSLGLQGLVLSAFLSVIFENKFCITTKKMCLSISAGKVRENRSMTNKSLNKSGQVLGKRSK